jgi:prevent-host-death family protein
MSSIGAFEAKTHFAQLLERAERGEAITITRRGRPVARLVPIGPGHDVAAARAAADRLRALAREFRAGGAEPFRWDDWKAYRDEGRR